MRRGLDPLLQVLMIVAGALLKRDSGAGRHIVAGAIRSGKWQNACTGTREAGR